ncbi:Endonuclease/exonuclease/phosphatase, partial [Collybia nuda]
MHGKNDKKGKSKWGNLTTLMRKNRIAILGIQESRLNENETEKTGKANPKIVIENNGVATNKEGVAFVINKDMMGDRKWIHTRIIEGRASRLQVDMGEENALDIILVYVPNIDSEKIKFIKNIQKELGKLKDLTEPILMGDFNFVENELDRFPHHKDKTGITDEFEKLRKKYKWIDGWRIHNPTEKNFSYFQTTSGSMSRIDRIYLTQELYTYAYNWEITTSANISDHDIVYVEILKKQLPYMGKGMWRMNENILEYEPFKKKARKILKEAEKAITECTKKLAKLNGQNKIDARKEQNPQEIWKETKTKLREEAQKEAKNRNTNLKKERTKLEKDL